MCNSTQQQNASVWREFIFEALGSSPDGANRRAPKGQPHPDPAPPVIPHPVAAIDKTEIGAESLGLSFLVFWGVSLAKRLEGVLKIRLSFLLPQ
jgi:hypothetical protein